MGTCRECGFPTSCRRGVSADTTRRSIALGRRGGRESPRVSPRAHGGRRRPRSARALRRARRRDAAPRGHARRGRAGRGGRRHRLPRLRRRDRLPEHRSRLRAGGRRDPRAGRPLSPSVLHGRHLRALRRGLPPARRALAVRGREPEVDPRQLRRGGGRERRQDRACRNGPARGRRLRERLPRPDAADDGDDEQGAPLQGGLRAVPRRDLSRRRAVPVPRHRHRRGDRVARAPVQERGRGRDGRVRRARDRAGRRGLHPDARRLPGAAARALRPARDPLRRRRGAVGRREDGADVGDRAQRRRP